MTLTTLKTRVRRWQRRAGLSDWDITVKIVRGLRVGKKAVHAAARCVDQRATIEFDEESLNTLDSESLDHIIVHELQHVIDDPQEDVFVKFLGKKADTGLFYKEWAAAEEKACDHRAAALVNAYRRKRDRH